MFPVCIASNLLFVESPAGVGWSYSNTSSDYSCGDASTGKNGSTYLLRPAFTNPRLFSTFSCKGVGLDEVVST